MKGYRLILFLGVFAYTVYYLVTTGKQVAVAGGAEGHCKLLHRTS
jgi:hypothetical protein